MQVIMYNSSGCELDRWDSIETFQKEVSDETFIFEEGDTFKVINDEF